MSWNSNSVKQKIRFFVEVFCQKKYIPQNCWCRDTYESNIAKNIFANTDFADLEKKLYFRPD
jgi:hypothetical protein